MEKKREKIKDQYICVCHVEIVNVKMVQIVCSHFMCSCGEFIIDATFAARIEFIGCRSWIPSDDDYNEPYLIKIDEKHKTVEIGKWGKEFKSLDADELVIFVMLSVVKKSKDDGMSAMILECREAYGE